MPPKTRGKKAAKTPAKKAARDVFEGVSRYPGAPFEGNDLLCDAKTEAIKDTRKPGRRCRKVDDILCCSVCGPSRVWRRKAYDSKKCIKNDTGEGFCCTVATPPEMYDRSYQTERAFVEGTRLKLVFVSAAGKAVFPGDSWGRYAIDKDGDCFYNAMSKAINAIVVDRRFHLEKMTVHKLRWASAMHVSPGAAFAARRQWYIGDAPEALKDEYAMVKKASELQAMMLHPDHWATMMDVHDVSENLELDVIPIVINANFGQKTAGGEAIHPMMNPLTVHYGASKHRLSLITRATRFVLLLFGGQRVGNHFELIVNKDKRLTDDGREFYDPLFTIGEIPKDVMDSFGIQLVD